MSFLDFHNFHVSVFVAPVIIIYWQIESDLCSEC